MPATLGPSGAFAVFYSYAHEDEELLDKLDRQLSLLKWENRITVWSDSNVIAGSTAADEINDQLSRADIILLLISPDFINSERLYSFEMKRALERHEAGEARVIPIILRPVEWQKMPIAKLQVLPSNQIPVSKWDNPDAAFLNIAEEIRRVIEDQDKTIHLPPPDFSNYRTGKPQPDITEGLIPVENSSSEGPSLPWLIGPDGPIELSRTILTIGRDQDNTLVVNDPGVSEHHAEIHSQVSGYTIVDLGSTNGTYVDWLKIGAHHHKLLKPGDSIYIGQTIFHYMYAKYGAPTSTKGSPRTVPQQESVVVTIPRRSGCLGRPIIIVLVLTFILLAALTAYAYNIFIQVPADQSRALTTFCDALKNQQYAIAYNLLSSRDKGLISEAQFANEFGVSDASLKITRCVFSSSSLNNGSGTITLTFANGGTVKDSYTLVQENGMWKIDLKSP